MNVPVEGRRRQERAPAPRALSTSRAADRFGAGRGPGPGAGPGARPSPPPGRASRFPDAATRRRVLRRRRQVAALLLLFVLAVLSFGGLVLANVGDAPPLASLHVARTATLAVGPAVGPATGPGAGPATPARPATGTATDGPGAAPGGKAVAGAPAPGPPLPWAPAGGSAVAVPAVGFAAQSGPEQPAPVASLTKLMTAYIVLRDHPIRPRHAGPSITVTGADAQQFGTDTVTDQSNVELRAGERLSELQMLEGLLIHSANDLAYSLAGWDAGSVPAFVTKMNAAATALGMSHTHFADASGFDPASVSTPADLLRVAAVCMRDPVFRSIVTQSSVTLPLAGTVSTYTPMLGTPGVIGVKSGFTTSAGGNDILAYRALAGGRMVTALAAVTNQEGPTVLQHAGQQALALAQAALARVTADEVAPRGLRVGWAEVAGSRVDLVLAHPATLEVAPGTAVRRSVVVRHRPSGGAPAGTTVGWASFSVGTQRVRVPVVTAGALPVPSLLQRLW